MLFLLGALAPLLLAASARADEQATAPTTWAVRMAPGSRCTSDDGTFLATLAAQVPEGQRASSADAELIAEISVGERVAQIRVYDRILQAEAGARELPLTERHCVDIAPSVALVLGVLVEAGRGALTSDPEEQPAAPAKPAAEPIEQPSRREASERPKAPAKPSAQITRARPVWRGPPAGHDLAAAVGINLGLVPRPVLGFSGGWGIRPAKSWPIWLVGSGWYGAESRDGVGLISSYYGGVLTCPLTLERRPLRLRACVGLQAGAVLAESRNIVRTSQARRPVALATLELAAHVQLLGPLEFTLLARADVLLTRSRFFYRDSENERQFVYDPSPVYGGPFAGFTLRLR